MTEIGSFLSDWVKAEELNNLKDRTAIVYPTGEGELISKEFRGEMNTKHEIPVKFLGNDRKYTMNKTSDRAIAEEYGMDDKDWVGKPILIESSNQIVSGKPTDVIYARVPTAEEVKKYGEVSTSPTLDVEEVPRKTTITPNIIEKPKEDTNFLYKHNVILNGIEEVKSRYGTDYAEENDLETYAATQGLDKEQFEVALWELTKAGEIFTPKPNCYQRVLEN
jgi:hypothetical protein